MNKMMEDMPSLPKGWTNTELGDICKTTSGGTPSRKNKEYYGGNIPWLKSGELNNAVINYSQETITEIGLRNSSAKVIPKGTLLIALYGATTGKLGILGIDAAINQAICAIFPYDEISNRYLFWYLTKYRNELLNVRIGGAQPNISQTILKGVSLPLPPVPEQRRIVVRIEELFTELDAGVESLRKVKAQLVRYRQAVLKHAFKGKLTEQWRKNLKNETEPAFMLLDQIRERLKKMDKWRFQKQQSIEVKNLPSLPEKWVWTKISEVSYLVTKGSTPTSYGYNYVSKGINFIKVKNIAGGRVQKESIQEYIEEDTHNFLRRSQLKENDVLFSIAGTIGRTALVHNLDLPANTNQAVAIIRCPWKFIIPDYLRIFLDSHMVILQMSRRLRGVGMNNVGLRDIKEILFPLAPFNEQKRIVEELDRRMSIISQVEVIVTRGFQQTERVRQSILKRAFEGRLVSQDPTDEPAEKMIKRIKETKKESGEKQMELLGYVK